MELTAKKCSRQSAHGTSMYASSGGTTEYSSVNVNPLKVNYNVMCVQHIVTA